MSLPKRKNKMKKLFILISIIFLSCDITEPDTTPPTVTITFPINESTLTEISTIKVNASDNEEIVNVIFIIDGLTVYEDTQAPYEFEWNVCDFYNSQHSLLVEAKDESGNVGQSDLLTYTINAVYDCADICAGTAEIRTYWFDMDNDSLGSGEPSKYCDALVEESWVLNNNDGDDNCLSNFHDCEGVCDGDALEDMCGTCDNDLINDCIQDCDDTWGGTNWESDCGCVSINNAGDDCDDCNGIPDGNSEVDLCGICEGDNTTCTISDYDGNIYETVIIGNQEWMSENLKVTHYNNGDAIPNITNNGDWSSLTTGAYGDTNSVTYGRLYNWYTVDDNRGVCPVDYHVPTDAEYKTLEMYLGMSQSEAEGTGSRGTNEGSKLAGNALLWTDDDLENNAEFGTSSFAGLPSGYRYSSNGSYYFMGNYGCF
jgi:uncharacterized protein (TIGR02145 family)